MCSLQVYMLFSWLLDIALLPLYGIFFIQTLPYLLSTYYVTLSMLNGFTYAIWSEWTIGHVYKWKDMGKYV